MNVKIKTKIRQNDLFRGALNSRLNACVGDNGGRYDMSHYAHGYFAATRKILEAANVFEVGVAVDTLVYPACNCFRHSIELFIKYLIDSYARLLDEKDMRYETNHGLHENWLRALSAAERYDWSPFAEEQINLIQKTIIEFNEIDPRGVIFRYPDSIKGEQHLKDWTLINLGVVLQRADQVFEIFEDWGYRIDARMSY
jgi:hypothetical protein